MRFELLEQRRVLSGNGYEDYSAVGQFAVPRRIAQSSDPLAVGFAGSNYFQQGSNLYFTANDGVHGDELWVTQGTAGSTHLVKDIYAGTGGGFYLSSNPESFVEFDDKLYFIADSQHGRGLWVSDGTESGTQAVVYSGLKDWTDLTVVNNLLYYTKRFSNGLLAVDDQLWRFDGTTHTLLHSTGMVNHSSSEPTGIYSLVDFYGTPYFLTVTHNPSASGLWRVTGSGAELVRSIPIEYAIGYIIIGGFGPVHPLLPPTSLTVVGDKMYFEVDYTDVWTSDGTAAGTNLVHQWGDPTSNGSYLSIEGSLNGQLLFVTADSWSPYQLWCGDGTIAGSTLLKTFSFGASDAAPGFKEFFHDGLMYFASGDGANGTELWRTDGTAAGTFRLTTFGLQPENNTFTSLMHFVGEVGSFVYFVGGDALHRWRLWRSDGTVANTQLVADIEPASLPAALFNGRLYFTAYTPNIGTEIWSINGVLGNVEPLDTGENRFLHTGSAYDVTGAGDYVYYLRSEQSPVGPPQTKLWRANRDGSGATIIRDWQPSNFGSEFTTLGSELAFSAMDSPTGQELNIVDGSSGNLLIIDSISPGPSSAAPEQLTDVNGTLFFSATEFSGADTVEGFESGNLSALPWINSGSGGGWSVTSSRAKSGAFSVASPTGTGSLKLTIAINASTELLFDYRNETGQSEPFQLYVDGVPQYVDLTPDSQWRDWRVLVEAGTHTFEWLKTSFTSGRVYLDNLVFPTHFEDRELWKSDGTLAGTQRVKDINPHGSSIPSSSDFFNTQDGKSFANVNGTLFFIANDGQNGDGLWKSDGTEAGTVLVHAFGARGEDGLINRMVVAGTKLFFMAYDDAHGYELWVSDGTPAGTHPVKDIEIGSGSSYAMPVAAFQGKALFGVWNSDGVNNDLWITDGTEAGTTFVHSVSVIDEFQIAPVVTQSGVYFAGVDQVHGQALWRTDGTPAGTQMVIDTAPGYLSSGIRSLIAVNDTLFFVANNPEPIPGGGTWQRRDLWISDGTAAGTRVVDITESPIGPAIALYGLGDQIAYTMEADLGLIDVAADFNNDGAVNGDDFLTWQRGLGASGSALFASGDANGDGAVGASDLVVWRKSFGSATLQTHSLQREEEALSLNDQVLLLPPALLNARTALTVETWFRTTYREKQTILSAANLTSGAINSQLTLQVDPNNHAFVLIDANRSRTMNVGASQLADGQWHHVALVRNPVANSYELYLDGVATSTINDLGNLAPLVVTGVAVGQLQGHAVSAPAPQEPAGVMGPYSFGKAFYGEIDELRFWQSARTFAEISQVRNAELTGAELGLLAYYDFEDRSAKNRATSGSALDGRLGDGPLSEFVGDNDGFNLYMSATQEPALFVPGWMPTTSVESKVGMTESAATNFALAAERSMPSSAVAEQPGARFAQVDYAVTELFFGGDFSGLALPTLAHRPWIRGRGLRRK